MLSIDIADVASIIPEYLILGSEEFAESYESEAMIIAVKDKTFYFALFGYCSCNYFGEETKESILAALTAYETKEGVLKAVDDHSYIGKEDAMQWAKDTLDKWTPTEGNR